ncbi:hypothetical protein HK097_005467, partial [Rhizophlyctis rosea]
MAAKTANIVLLRGDGVGPEVVAEAKKVLEVVADTVSGLTLTFSDELIGGAAIDATGDPLPQKTLDACRASAGVLLGAVGGPQWPRPAT